MHLSSAKCGFAMAKTLPLEPLASGGKSIREMGMVLTRISKGINFNESKREVIETKTIERTKQMLKLMQIDRQMCERAREKWVVKNGPMNCSVCSTGLQIEIYLTGRMIYRRWRRCCGHCYRTAPELTLPLSAQTGQLVDSITGITLGIAESSWVWIELIRKYPFHLEICMSIN